MSDRVWVNADSTVLVSLWPDGTLTIATRAGRDHTWRPPVYLVEEKYLGRLADSNWSKRQTGP